MKKAIQPEVRLVLFEDMQTKAQYLIESVMQTKDKGIYEKDGKEYPMYRLDVTADSHPFYTGEQSFVKRAGQVDKFNKKYINKEGNKWWKKFLGLLYLHY